MNKLKFIKDECSEFYKELDEKIEQHFADKGMHKTGNMTMTFKVILYFSLDTCFYALVITSITTIDFYAFYLLMELFVLLSAFNISNYAAHGVAVKSKF
jgi:linoleoyl-CoA desaturase